jgi:apolipoprotein D and lipocalin family protein
VVGDPGRDYLWILSREPRMDDATYNQIIECVKQQGYEVGRLMKSAQPS